MKKTIALGFAALLLSTTAQASTTWGPEELKLATTAAFEAFETHMSEEAYLGITGLSIKMRKQKNAATVEMTYVEAGEEGSESYFCHNHGATIDCH